MTPRVHTLRSEHLTLDVLPEIGASVLNLRAASGRPVLRAVDPADVKSSSQCASFSLVPFSNRVRDARFTFAGQPHQLRVTTADGLTQHGDVRNRPWQAEAATPEALSFTFDSRQFGDLNWPWAFTARMEYRLSGAALEMTLSLTNVDRAPMPAGLGLHPYFARREDGVDPQVAFGAPRLYDTDERSLPLGAARALRPDEDFRAPRPVGERTIDQVYAGWDGEARLDWGARALTMRADPVFSHLVAFTAPDGSLALEPVSHATDALNLAPQGVPGVDLRVLAPGETLGGAVRLTLEGQW